jgi:hypothetical protein
MPIGQAYSDKDALKQRFEDLQRSEFDLEMYDEVSQRKIAQPIEKIGDAWRVDD